MAIFLWLISKGPGVGEGRWDQVSTIPEKLHAEVQYLRWEIKLISMWQLDIFAKKWSLQHSQISTMFRLVTKHFYVFRIVVQLIIIRTGYLGVFSDQLSFSMPNWHIVFML